MKAAEFQKINDDLEQEIKEAFFAGFEVAARNNFKTAEDAWKEYNDEV